MKKRNHKKKSYSLIIAIFLSALFLLTGCGSSGGGGSSAGGGGGGTTNVTISLNTPAVSSVASSSFKAAAWNSSSVVSMTIEISGPGMTTMSDTFNITGSSVTRVYSVPTGNDRSFTIRAYSGPMGSGVLLYESAPYITDLGGTDVSIPIAMLHSVVIEALKALDRGEILSAHELFKASEDAFSGEGSDSEYISNFFYALTRIWVFWFAEPNNEGFNNVGNIFEAFCGNGLWDPVNFNGDYMDNNCPDIVPDGHPTGSDLREDFQLMVIDELSGAIASLNNIPDTFQFSITWTEPFDGSRVESDLGDALFIRAIYKAAMAAHLDNMQYDPNVDIPTGTDLNNYKIGNFLSDNEGFPELIAGADLSASKDLQIEVLNDINLALDAIEDELFVLSILDTDQSDDWISLGDTVKETVDSIQNARTDIDKAIACYNDGNYGECIIDGDETVDPSDDTKIDLGPYFNDTVHVNTLWPAFEGVDPIGPLHDPYFGGMLTLIKGSDPADLDADEDGDNNADIFQSNLYYVYGGFEPIIYEDACKDPAGNYGFTLLGTAGTENLESTFSGSINFEYYIIKFEPKDLGFFSDLVDPDVYLDAIELLDIQDTYIGSLYPLGINYYVPNIPDPVDGINYPGRINFYGPNIFGSSDGISTWINDSSNCIIVDNVNYKVDKLTVYTVQ